MIGSGELTDLSVSANGDWASFFIRPWRQAPRAFLLDLKTGEGTELKGPRDGEVIRHVKLTREGNRAFVIAEQTDREASWQGTRVYYLDRGDATMRPVVKCSTFSDLSLSADGRLIAVDSQVLIAYSHQVLFEHPSSTSDVLLSPDGRRAYYADQDRILGVELDGSAKPTPILDLDRPHYRMKPLRLWLHGLSSDGLLLFFSTEAKLVEDDHDDRSDLYELDLTNADPYPPRSPLQDPYAEARNESPVEYRPPNGRLRLYERLQSFGRSSADGYAPPSIRCVDVSASRRFLACQVQPPKDSHQPETVVVFDRALGEMIPVAELRREQFGPLIGFGGGESFLILTDQGVLRSSQADSRKWDLFRVGFPSIDRSSAAEHLELGKLALSAGEEWTGREALWQALSLHRDLLDAYVLLARSYSGLSEGPVNDIGKALVAGLKKNPYLTNDLKSSLKWYEHALRLAPDDAHLAAERAWCELLSVKKWDTKHFRYGRVIESFERAAALNPGSFGIQRARGNLARRLGNADLARKAWLRAKEIESRNAHLLADLGQLRAEQGELSLALQELDAALSLEVREDAALGVLYCLERLRRLEEYGARVADLSRVLPDSTRLRKRLGDHLLRSGDPAGAAKAFEAAASEGAFLETENMYFLAGQAHHAAGQYARAVESQEKALNAWKEHRRSDSKERIAEVIYELGSSHLANGDAAAALRQFTELSRWSRELAAELRKKILTDSRRDQR